MERAKIISFTHAETLTVAIDLRPAEIGPHSPPELRHLLSPQAGDGNPGVVEVGPGQSPKRRGSMVMTPRIDAEFVEWPSAPDDRTLGVVDFSIFPHLGHEHISRMYRKLGLRSRTELSRLDPARLDADHGRWLDAPPDSVRTIA